MNMTYLKYKEGFPVIIPGKSLTSAEAASLAEYADIIIRENPLKIAINLENVEAIDSNGISFLVKISKATRNENIELILFGMNESLQRLFSVGGLDTFFTICTPAEFRKIYEK
jgi:anti-anti-sigma factor